MMLNPIQVGNEGEEAEAKDFLYVDAFNGGKAMSCLEVIALVKRLVGNDVTLSDDCMLAVPTLRQVHRSWNTMLYATNIRIMFEVGQPKGGDVKIPGTFSRSV